MLHYRSENIVLQKETVLQDPHSALDLVPQVWNTQNQSNQILEYPTRDSAKLFVQALIVSHLGFCNSLQPIQIMENTTVCLLLIIPGVSNMKPFLPTQHWVPVIWQLVGNINFGEICMFIPPGLTAQPTFLAVALWPVLTLTTDRKHSLLPIILAMHFLRKIPHTLSRRSNMQTANVHT